MSKVQKFKNKIDNFFGWVKVTELVELEDIDVSEDPVRPELDLEWRTNYGRKIYGLKYQDEIEGIICIAYTNDIPCSTKELDLMSQNAYFKEDADTAFDAATCIGCGACVASCKNSSAMLFVSAKVSQFSLLPQGQVEAKERVLNMVNKMDEEGFGNCTNTGACEVECPKGISLDNISRMNREFLSANIKK